MQSIKDYFTHDMGKMADRFGYGMSNGTGVSNLNGDPYQVRIGLRYAF